MEWEKNRERFHFLSFHKASVFLWNPPQWLAPKHPSFKFQKFRMIYFRAPNPSILNSQSIYPTTGDCKEWMKEPSVRRTERVSIVLWSWLHMSWSVPSRSFSRPIPSLHIQVRSSKGSPCEWSNSNYHRLTSGIGCSWLSRIFDAHHKTTLLPLVCRPFAFDVD